MGKRGKPLKENLNKANVKKYSSKYTLNVAAGILGISESYLKKLRKDYGLIKSKKVVK